MSAARRYRGRVLFIGTAYYNTWYLSRALRARGWLADTFSDVGDGAHDYMHGCDYRLRNLVSTSWPPEEAALIRQITREYLEQLRQAPPPPPGSTHPRRTVFTRWLRRWLPLRKRCSPPTSTAELIQRLIQETDSETLALLLPEFLQRLYPHPPAELQPLCNVVQKYDILHFCGVQNLRFFYFFNPILIGCLPIGWDIALLRRLGKKIVYSITGCLDGVAQSSFRRWGPYPICDICRWRDVPEVCSDQRNLEWGHLRNHLTDYIINIGGNRIDYNNDERVHEVPEFYCLDPDFWRPDLEIPEKYRLPWPSHVVKIYHAVGNYHLRTRENQKNIKTTHIIVPAVQRLKAAGYPVELIFCTDVPNQDVRFYQVQADIVVDMLTYGFFGANIREALMLGKAAVCYLRPEWLENMRREVPGYVDELPVVSATPETIEQVLVDLIKNPQKRQELGQRGRQFALKWHSAQVAARRLEEIYLALLAGKQPQR